MALQPPWSVRSPGFLGQHERRNLGLADSVKTVRMESQRRATISWHLQGRRSPWSPEDGRRACAPSVLLIMTGERASNCGGMPRCHDLPNGVPSIRCRRGRRPRLASESARLYELPAAARVADLRTYRTLAQTQLARSV